MAVDITNHLITWAIAKRMQAGAWDEGYDACAHYHSLDTEHSEPNPYREDV